MALVPPVGTNQPALQFGVFPLGIAGAPGGVAAGRPDDHESVAGALGELSGEGRPLMPRMYVNWLGRWWNKVALGQVRRIAEAAGPPHDLVLCYRDSSGNVEAWARFVARVVRDYGRRLAAVAPTARLASAALSTPRTSACAALGKAPSAASGIAVRLASPVTWTAAS